MIIPAPLWGGVKDKHYVSTQIAKKEADYEDYRFYWEGLDGETGLY